VETRERFIPLRHLAPEGKQAQFCVYNSPLSEVSVLAFDYGYSLDYPKMLCMWEAQFGDFSNGAQVVMDQFISSAESKWQRSSGLVMLLPHGNEGQGPEHSSARPERYLQLCAEDNMQICNLTTPAQFFHVLRRQMSLPHLKPLVVFTPKSLLRSPLATSKSSDFLGKTSFAEILETPPTSGDRAKASRVILCTGKVYYDLLTAVQEQKLTDVALVRVEQLYPLHTELLTSILEPYGVIQRGKAQPDAKAPKVVWCQEESKNMGAWSFICPYLTEILGYLPKYAGRVASASPAVGAKKVHDFEQNALVQQALTE
jgi:2-oxoglutarate dehydrogenase E1 component